MVKSYSIAVVGATGLVGQTMLKVLAERKFPLSKLYLVASDRSTGKVVNFSGQPIQLIAMKELLSLKPDIALFSAGSSVSIEWAPKLVSQGTVVIDNSSAWRMDENVPLVVPEINAYHIHADHKIIANPNCSTIQLLMALAPLHKRFIIKRVIISTYQSVSGSGQSALKQMESEESGLDPAAPVYPYPIYRNCIPQCDIFLENDYTKEEMKLVHESRKILGVPGLRITATAVRVPVHGGHSESVNVEFERPYEMAEVREILQSMPGVKLEDSPDKLEYPMPLNAFNKDEVFVGRLRRDETIANGLNLWIVADNIRKGAATNAVQIAEYVCSEALPK